MQQPTLLPQSNIHSSSEPSLPQLPHYADHTNTNDSSHSSPSLNDNRPRAGNYHKQKRIPFTEHQLQILNNEFALNSYVSRDASPVIAARAQLSEKQVKEW